MTNFEMVKQFMNIMGQEVRNVPSWPDNDTRQLRLDLMQEELHEIEAGVLVCDIENVAKELADMLYVVYGTAAAFGINVDAVFEQVHLSNLSKLDDNGKPIFNEVGKVQKGPNYREPDVSAAMCR